MPREPLALEQFCARVPAIIRTLSEAEAVSFLRGFALSVEQGVWTDS